MKHGGRNETGGGRNVFALPVEMSVLYLKKMYTKKSAHYAKNVCILNKKYLHFLQKKLHLDELFCKSEQLLFLLKQEWNLQPLVM